MTIVSGLNIHRRQISFNHPDIVTGEVRRRTPACSVNVPFLSNLGRADGGLQRGWCDRVGLQGCAGSGRP